MRAFSLTDIVSLASVLRLLSNGHNTPVAVQDAVNTNKMPTTNHPLLELMSIAPYEYVTQQVARARPLTEQNWKKLQPHLVGFMEEIKRSSHICGYGVKGQFSTKVGYWELDGVKAVYGPFEAYCGVFYGEDR
ncbi:uncharacterized protein ARMOST_11997 [Armillaria ostoyae]|uniref:Uncharacterized protein n=1 Tax=Armillaria ostoyae TaxID=47428 RepID=A0A284RIP2_ARMOS|nr:uncharacterized protein ARMOST_11997 [Armillaria ostoyae]